MSLTNSVEGFADLLANQADIALTMRPLSQDELALARDAGLGQQTNRRVELGAVGLKQPRGPKAEFA